MHPQPESYWGHVNPVGPRGVYDEAKRFAEAMTMAYHRFHGMETRIVRIFNTYGPRMRPNDGRVVTNFIVQALAGEPLTIYGDGEQTRSFCYVDDLVRASTVSSSPSAPSRPISAIRDEFTIRALAEQVRADDWQPSSLRGFRFRRMTPRCAAPTSPWLARVLGWEPKIVAHGGAGAHDPLPFSACWRRVPWPRGVLAGQG